MNKRKGNNRESENKTKSKIIMGGLFYLFNGLAELLDESFQNNKKQVNKSTISGLLERDAQRN